MNDLGFGFFVRGLHPPSLPSPSLSPCFAPPFCFWGRPGFSCSFSWPCLLRRKSPMLDGTALHLSLSLSPRAGSPLPLPSLLFLSAFLFWLPLSLSLSLSFSCTGCLRLRYVCRFLCFAVCLLFSGLSPCSLPSFPFCFSLSLSLPLSFFLPLSLFLLLSCLSIGK